MTPDDPPADLQSPLESLFHTVWELERRWKVEDRIDLAASFVQPAPTRRAPPRPRLGR